MPKIYFEDFKPNVQTKKSPKKEVLDTILAFSKSLEVIKIDSENKTDKNVEVILN